MQTQESYARKCRLHVPDGISDQANENTHMHGDPKTGWWLLLFPAAGDRIAAESS